MPLLVWAVLAAAVFPACTFDYGSTEEDTEGRPDLVMDNVEYVRVRKGDPQVRFYAEKAERYEENQRMNLNQFTFEQFDKHGEEVNASGRAGAATVELETGNVDLGDGVSISVKSEDFTVETDRLHWNDKEKKLSGDEQAEVNILRENGTNFYGKGFSADARSRTWGFTNGLGGTYIHDDDEDEEETAEGEAAASETAESSDTADDTAALAGEADEVLATPTEMVE